MKKRILILSFSELHTDPRVLRQIQVIQTFPNNLECIASGYSPPANKSIDFYPIYKVPEFSLWRKFKRFLQFICRFYDKYYWDENKIRVYKHFINQKIDLIIANDIITLPLALKIADKKTKVWFDAHEYHPKEWEDNIMWRLFFQPYIAYLCKNYIPKSNIFTTVSEGIANEYNKTFKVTPEVITNATEYYNLKPSVISNNKIRIIHHGAAIRSRRIELMIELIKYLDKRFTIDFILTGNDLRYISHLKKHVEDDDRIKFLPPLNKDEICSFINSYDIGLYILSSDNFNHRYSLPNKFFEFIQARLCLAISPNPEMAKIIKRYNLGIIADDFTPQSMAKALNSLSTEDIMKFKNNSHIAAKELSSENNFQKMIQIINKLIN